jgi:amino acid adenylation domain-containing protein
MSEQPSLVPGGIRTESRFQELFSGAVHYWFEAQVCRTPESTAVISADRTLPYFTLNQEANRLGHYLQRQRVKPETTVGVCLDASSMLAVAVFGVLKAGGAYVFIEPSFPPERIRFMLQDANVSILITEEKFLSAFASECPQTLCLDKDWPFIINQSTENPYSSVTPKNTAYILYTSGSTGKPKGVVVEHRNLSYYLNWWCNILRTDIDADLPLTSSFSFAAAVSQFFGQLLVGRELYILSRDLVRQPDLLLAWFSGHSGHGLYCVPTLWDGIVNCAERWLKEEKPAISPACLYLTGESPPRKLLDRTFAIWPQLDVWNLYGPTEAVANVSAQKLGPGQPISVGQPIPGTHLHLLDEKPNPDASGADGELYVSGEGVARGYLNRPDLSAARFLPNPFNVREESRLYRTGDLCRLRPDGSLEYLGRADNQVKIRGFRIELQEIETVLLEHPAVRQAVVVALETEAGEKRLAAYIVCNRSPEPGVREIRVFLQRYLPDYMIPGHFIFLNGLPLLLNGKLDRGALPVFSHTHAQSGHQYEAPRTPTEVTLEQIWAEILGSDKLGIHDNFFEMGGDSLRAADIITRVRQHLRRDVSYRHLFDFPTIASFAEIVEKSAPCTHEASGSALKRVPRTAGIRLSH